MPGKILEQLVSSYMKTLQPCYIFAWQGGEPTLMGVDFFRKVVKLQQKYGKPGSSISNGMQTNAVIIDDELAEFFARYNFLLGVSLDGPGYMHDSYRKYKNGIGSYKDVMKGIDCLKRNGVDFNIITLVSKSNVRKGKEVYHFLCDKGFFYHQYIECVEFDKKGNPLSYTITGEEWGNFLCEIYDEWIKSDIYRVSIRLFDSILTYMVENRYNVCSMGRKCGQYFVVEYNGDIYPCDFFVDKDLRIGNISRGSWFNFLQSPIYTNFANKKSIWNSECDICNYNSFCSGDCSKNRFYSQENPGQLSWLCKGWKTFYDHAIPGFRKIAGNILEERKGINH